MVGEIQTLEERKNKLIAKGKKQGFITYEQLAEELKGLDVDSDSLDSLALKYYGRPDLFWVIADFNNLNDPYIRLVDKMSSIKIPSLSGITWR